MKKINCPLLQKEIEYDICFDISMVSENNSPERFAPSEVIKIENYKQICLDCENHRYD